MIPRGQAGLMATAAVAVAAALPHLAAGQDAAWTSPVTWWVASRTTGYWLENIDPATGTPLGRVSFYQSVDGSVTQLWNGHVDLRLGGRFADAESYPGTTTNEARLYVGYAQLRFAPWTARGRLGRQFLQEGPASLTLDGAWASLRPSRLVEIRLWGGVRAPADLDWEVQNFDERAAFGARLMGTLTASLRLGLSAAQWEERGHPAARPVSGEVHWFPLDGLRAFTRAEYETEGEHWRRVEILGDYVPARGSPWGFRAQVLDRAPRIDNTSYFARFQAVERIRAARASVRYRMANGFGAEVESFGSDIDGRTASRFGGAVLFPYGRLGYSARFSDNGEESQWFGDVDVAVRPWARLAAGAMVSTYALFEDAPPDMERDLVALFARATLEIFQGVRGVAEVQGLQNPGLDEDVRLLLGLDLFAGRGASGFGLDRGGWRP